MSAQGSYRKPCSESCLTPGEAPPKGPEGQSYCLCVQQITEVCRPRARAEVHGSLRSTHPFRGTTGLSGLPGPPLTCFGPQSQVGSTLEFCPSSFFCPAFPQPKADTGVSEAGTTQVPKLPSEHLSSSTLWCPRQPHLSQGPQDLACLYGVTLGISTPKWLP